MAVILDIVQQLGCFQTQLSEHVCISIVRNKVSVSVSQYRWPVAARPETFEQHVWGVQTTKLEKSVSLFGVRLEAEKTKLTG